MYQFIAATAMTLILAGQAPAQSRDPYTGADSNLCGGICSTPNGGTLYRSGPEQTYRYSPPAPQQDVPRFNPSAPTVNPVGLDESVSSTFHSADTETGAAGVLW